jgi:hypothetical protein
MDVTEVTFRYSTSAPAQTVPNPATAQAGSGTISDYIVVRAHDFSTVYISDCTFEAVPNFLTTEATQASYTKYVTTTNYAQAFLRNITINGNNPRLGNGTVTTNYSMGRYFAQALAGGAIYFYGTFTLQNNPRFNVFVEPSRTHGIVWFNSDSSHPFGQFSWSGSFGSQLGSGGGNQLFDLNPASAGRDYQPLQAKNYILKDDGPFAYVVLRTSGQPANSFLYSYTTAQVNATRFTFVDTF